MPQKETKLPIIFKDTERGVVEILVVIFRHLFAQVRPDEKKSGACEKAISLASEGVGVKL